MVRSSAAQQRGPAGLFGFNLGRRRTTKRRHARVTDGLERHSVRRGVRTVAANFDARQALVHKHAVARAQLAVAIVGVGKQHHATFALCVGHHLFEGRATEGDQLTPLFARQVGINLRQHEDDITATGRQLDTDKDREVAKGAAGNATRNFGRGFAVCEQDGIETGSTSSAHDKVGRSATRGTRVGMKINQHGKTPRKAGGGYHATQVMSTFPPLRRPHRKPPRDRARFASGAQCT